MSQSGSQAAALRLFGRFFLRTNATATTTPPPANSHRIATAGNRSSDSVPADFSSRRRPASQQARSACRPPRAGWPRHRNLFVRRFARAPSDRRSGIGIGAGGLNFRASAAAQHLARRSANWPPPVRRPRLPEDFPESRQPAPPRPAPLAPREAGDGPAARRHRRLPPANSRIPSPPRPPSATHKARTARPADIPHHSPPRSGGPRGPRLRRGCPRRVSPARTIESSRTDLSSGGNWLEIHHANAGRIMGHRQHDFRAIGQRRGAIAFLSSPVVPRPRPSPSPFPRPSAPTRCDKSASPDRPAEVRRYGSPPPPLFLPASF